MYFLWSERACILACGVGHYDGVGQHADQSLKARGGTGKKRTHELSYDTFAVRALSQRWAQQHPHQGLSYRGFAIVRWKPCNRKAIAIIPCHPHHCGHPRVTGAFGSSSRSTINAINGTASIFESSLNLPC